MDKDAFLQALRDDPVFAAEVLSLLVPYLRADLSTDTETIPYYYTDGSGKEVVTVSADFYAEGTR